MAVASAGHRLAVGTDLVVGTDLGVETPDLAAGTGTGLGRLDDHLATNHATLTFVWSDS